MRIEGRVVKRRHAAGSKSEHEAIYLEGTSGSFKLRMPGANPFEDSGLYDLVGKSIAAEGDIDKVSNQFFVSRWRELP